MDAGPTEASGCSEPTNLVADAQPLQRRRGRVTTRAVARVLVGVAAAIVVGWLVASVRADLRDAISLLGHVNLGWTAVALAAGFVTLALFAGVRVVLVGAVGGRLGVVESIGLTYASGAIAASIPAGGPIATAYVFGQYRRVGADAGGATWALLVNGVITPAALAVVGLAGLALASPSGAAAVLVPVGIAGAFVAVAVALLRSPDVLTRPIAAGMRVVQRLRGFPLDGVDEKAREITQRLGQVRPSRARWVTAVLVQIASWLVDVVCLAASILAVGGTVPWRSLLTVYCAGQLVGRLPLLPAGLGQVETGLVVGLTAAHVPVAIGLAATLVYRVASQWIVVPIGWVCWWYRRRAAAADDTELESHAAPA